MHAGVPNPDGEGYLFRASDSSLSSAIRIQASGDGVTYSILRRQIPTPDHPRAEQAQPDPGADRDRGGDPAAPARRHHQPPRLGPRRRHPRHSTSASEPDRCLTTGSRQAGGRGEPSAALRHLVISTLIMGSPARRLNNPITRCWVQPHHRYAGTDDRRGTDQPLTQSDLR
jgi:hypothetical protein